MSRTIDTWRDPYDIGVSMTTPKQITIEKGLTVLVGCNGCGKTTLLHNIKQHLERNKIPFYFFDNLPPSPPLQKAKILATTLQ